MLSVIAQEGSFSRAAARLHLTQPAISQQISKMEQELGASLLDRLSSGVRLTAAGELLVRKARVVTAQLGDVRREISDMDQELTGTLAVGAIPTIAPYLLPSLLRRFRTDHPHVRLHLVEDVTSSLLRQLKAGELDLAIMSSFPETPTVHGEQIATEPLHLILSKKHRLARAEGDICLSDIDGEPFLALHDVHCLAGQVARYCERAGAHPEVVVRSTQLETVRAMVAAGCGVSLVPEMMCIPGSKQPFVCRAIRADQRPERAIMAAWSVLRYRSRCARAFLDEVKSTLKV